MEAQVLMWALLLVDLFPNVDKFKVIKMLLIHDLPEMYCGDILLFSKTEEDIKNEGNAANKLFLEDFPQPLGKRMLALWREFTFGNSKEAKIARAIDELQPMLQNINTGGISWKKHNISLTEVDTRKHKNVCVNKTISAIYNQLMKEAIEIMT